MHAKTRSYFDRITDPHIFAANLLLLKFSTLCFTAKFVILLILEPALLSPIFLLLLQFLGNGDSIVETKKVILLGGHCGLVVYASDCGAGGPRFKSC